MTVVKPEYVALDVEGPLVNPASDFAWLTYDELLTESTRIMFPRSLCENYDSKYDDGRYFYELCRSSRHSTGMWPLLSLALAAHDGKTDDDLIAYAEKTTQENPGTQKLMNYLVEEFDKRVLLTTSSHSAVGLRIAENYDIPFKQVFTNGFQPSGKILRQKDFVTEVKERSPMSVLSENKEELGKFLCEYTGVCEALGGYYDEVQRGEHDDNRSLALRLSIKAVLRHHDQLFEKIKDNMLRGTLEHLFLDEECVMGSHRKVDAMKSVYDDRRRLGFVGDGIVDGMGIEYADYGISINMTNKHALSFSKLNVATTDVSKLIPVFEAMFSGEFGGKLKDKLDSEEIRVFSISDIQRNIDAVVKVNREKKNELKALYVPVKP